MTSYPTPASEPDDGHNETFEPTTFPTTLSAEVVARSTLKFRAPRGDRETFEKLVVQKADGELLDVLCGRARLARLIVKHDPRVGDLISLTAFGPDEKGWHKYGLAVDKSQREQFGQLDDAETEEAVRWAEEQSS